MNAQPENNEITLCEFLETVTCYLSDLIEANKDLLLTLKQYQDHLVKGENDEIEHATPGLDRAAGKIRILDEKRRAFVDNYFVQMGWDGPRNFSAIEERVKLHGVNDDEAMAYERAAQVRMELIQILAEVDAQNSLNLTLIGQGLTFADISLRAIFGLDNNPGTYGPSDNPEDGPSILDAQA